MLQSEIYTIIYTRNELLFIETSPEIRNILILHNSIQSILLGDNLQVLSMKYILTFHAYWDVYITKLLDQLSIPYIYKGGT